MDSKTILAEMGKRISYRRKELHMTQESLADKMEVSTQTISYIETGKKGIRPENLIKLCSVLGVSADYILTGNDAVSAYGEISDRMAKLTPEQFLCLKNIIENSLNLIDTATLLD